MDKVQALQIICADVNNERLTPTSYARVRKALAALGFTGADFEAALDYMEYHRNGKPLSFLVARGKAFPEVSQ